MIQHLLLVLLVGVVGPSAASTVCSSSLRGVCISDASTCITGYHLTYSYCGSRLYCCYPPPDGSSSGSGSQSHTSAPATHAPATSGQTAACSSISGRCINHASQCQSGYHLTYSYCTNNDYCCYPPPGSSGGHTSAPATHAPTSVQSAECSRINGQCISSPSACSAGYYLTYSYCGFLLFCCYPPSGSSSSGGSSSGGSHGHTSAPVTPAPTSPSQQSGSCGVASVNDNHRIVGGVQTQAGEYPWQVSLRYNSQHLCGGTLIDRQWVLTAAHCFEDTITRGWSVALGINDIHRVSSSHVVRAAHVYTHGSYNNVTNFNDIALVKLTSPVDITGQYVRPACLPGGSDRFDNMVCTTTGWGATHDDGYAVRYMREVDLPIVSNNVCQYYIGRGRVHSTQICAGFLEGGKDSCQGDSGGPLVCQQDGVWKLAGVVSWGYGCAHRHSPGVYTRVSSYLSWIQSVQSRH